MFGPRHAHREGRILRWVEAVAPHEGLHLECAAGVGSLTVALAGAGIRVVAADSSMRSLAEAARRARGLHEGSRVLPVAADVTALPFADASFASATSAETLEHVDDDVRAAGELARVLEPGGCLVGTVPADPGQLSDWDDWAGHLRRYTERSMSDLLRGAGLEPAVTTWGWPVVRLYDALFLRRVNRRRLHAEEPATTDPGLRTVAALGRRRWLVGLVRQVMSVDRLFDGSPWGVGLLFRGQRSRRRSPDPIGREELSR
jgi:SAM-dependent methyltransferase